VSISSIEELRAIISRGSERRHTAGTNMNDESSRSHLILSIIIESTNLQTQSYARGKVRQDEARNLTPIWLSLMTMFWTIIINIKRSCLPLLVSWPPPAHHWTFPSVENNTHVSWWGGHWETLPGNQTEKLIIFQLLHRIKNLCTLILSIVSRDLVPGSLVSSYSYYFCFALFCLCALHYAVYSASFFREVQFCFVCDLILI